MTLYASTAQIKAALHVTDAIDDSLISMAGSAASELIDGYCGRSFGTVTEARYFAADDALVLQVDDIATTSGLIIQTSDFDPPQWEVTWATTDYQLEPLNGKTEGLTWAYTRIRAIGDYMWPGLVGEVGVKVTATFGWPAIPSAVTQAAVIQAMRIFKRLDTPLGVTYGELGAIRVSSRHLDGDVAQLVAPYVRHRGVA
jgi:hypothetical protein